MRRCGEDMSLKFGFMALPRSIKDTEKLAKFADQHGMSWMGIADSPVVYQDSYLHQFVALQNSCDMRVSAFVSHVILRHPMIVANMLSTLSDIGNDRVVSVIGTGNSAARGVGVSPATRVDLQDALKCMRQYWNGEAGQFRSSRVPRTDVTRNGTKIFLAGDGPLVGLLAGDIADGFVYGGSMNVDVLKRRIGVAKGESNREFWVAPAVSFADDIEGVVREIGPMVVAMANRAFRGDLEEKNVPKVLQADIKKMWEEYDYGYHADATRPKNSQTITDALTDYLITNLVMWGSNRHWEQWLGNLEEQGVDGIVFIFGQEDQVSALVKLTEKLRDVAGLS